jgi:O-methyltransferase
MQTPISLYVDLLKKSVLEELYVENELRLLYLRSCLEGKEPYRPDVYLDIRAHRPDMYREYAKAREVGMNYGRTIQNLGFQHTMLGRRRLENIEACLSSVLGDGIRGDCIECGVWRGGATVFMRGFLAAHGITDRTVWVADSFEGLPVPSHEKDAGLDLSKEKYPMLAITFEMVQDLFARYGLLDDQVRFLRGWFKDTLPTAPIRELALLRLDGDLYESTMDALLALYDKVSPGGYVIVDDYGCLPPCKQAITDFRAQRGITDPIEEVDWTGAFWRKTGKTS